MTYLADLHLHSSYSHGTSRQLTLENSVKWAKIKGIDLLSTGDFTHPARLEEISNTLRETDGNLLELDGVHFILGTEVNCIATQGGRNRRVHILAFAPSILSVNRINTELSRRGKLHSNGRPTLHMLPRELLQTLLYIDERCFIIPAHLWTPWFGLYGSKSGFDSLDECFDDLVDWVPAIESGLSSNPAMNWRVPSLDHVSIVSFSDAHSLRNMGRELTAFHDEPTYEGLLQALRVENIAYTIEFFPEEGKYHHSGHRKCSVSLTTVEVAIQGNLCPHCGRNLTLGVMQRVEDLSDKEVDLYKDERGFHRSYNNRPPFKNMVSLHQIISEALGYSTYSKTVQDVYSGLVSEVGNEIAVLLDTPTSEIDRISNSLVAECVGLVRSGKIDILPGLRWPIRQCLCMGQLNRIGIYA